MPVTEFLQDGSRYEVLTEIFGLVKNLSRDERGEPGAAGPPPIIVRE